MKSSAISLVLLGVASVSCTPEPARRSSVDSASLCSTDPDKPVWKGQCLRTLDTVNDDELKRSDPSETGGGAPVLPPTEEPKATPTGEPKPTETEIPKPTPSTGGGGPPPQNELDVLKGVIDKYGPGALEGIDKRLNGGGGTPSPTGGGKPVTEKVYVVTFSKDTFIGIADSAVVKNCFVGAGSVVEVKGQPQKIAEFTNVGVNQYVTGEALEVNLMGGSSDSCALKGKDFVYLGAHATVAAKP